MQLPIIGEEVSLFVASSQIGRNMIYPQGWKRAGGNGAWESSSHSGDEGPG
jgi:hypothetical protein